MSGIKIITHNRLPAEARNSNDDILVSKNLHAADNIIEVPDTAYTIKDQDDNILLSGIIPSGITNEITVTLPKDMLFKGLFKSGLDEMGEITIDADNAGNYTALSTDGSSGTITFVVNGGSPAAFSSPLVLTIGDTFNVFRTVDTSAGHFKLTGTY